MASEIVVGIDFGTTYSGVSWAVNAGNKVIRLISDWPSPVGGNTDNSKVPTTISYQNGKPHNWGNEVSLTEASFKWFKILLDPDHKFRNIATPVVASRSLLGKVNKTAEDVAADYLRLVWEYTKVDIAKHRGLDWENVYDVRVVLTVPAIWSPKAKDTTLRVAKAAGLPSRLQMVAEPEAAALAVLKDKTEDDSSLQVGDAFVVCDAGGGTVDLISYKITGLDPLRMEECAVGDGGLCGSVFLDAAFEKHVKMMVGEREYNSIKEVKRKRMLRDFEQGVKKAYDGGNKEYTVELVGVEEDLDKDIHEDMIKLKPNAIKTVFDHVINQIITLVESQIDEVQERGIRTKAVLLVGGFGSNRYLHQRLRDAHRGDGIAILQDTGAWSSICRGATLWGLENGMSDRSSSVSSGQKTVQARLSRHSYGLIVDVPFQDGLHLWKDRYKAQNGTWRARSQTDWLVRKGQRIATGADFDYPVYFTLGGINMWTSGVKEFSQKLHYCSDDDPPGRKEPNVKELCNVDFGVDYSKMWAGARSYKDENGVKWRDVHFKFKVRFDSAAIMFTIIYDNEVVAYTEADYKDSGS